MSKSLGNVVVPQEVTGKLGAEILRLWVAASDYSGELSISEEILDRVVEATAASATPCASCSPTPPTSTSPRTRCRSSSAGHRPLRARLHPPASQQAEADYAKMEFHRIVQALQVFCSEDLGAFYLDILKDRLYTTAAQVAACRAAPRRPRCGTSRRRC
jgi:isoleucyl-tRNA synthetase